MALQGGQTRVVDQWPAESEDLWVDIGPDEGDHIEPVVRHLYPVHPVTISRVLDGNRRRPTVLVEDDAVVFVVSLDPSSQEGAHRHLAIFLGKHFLVTVQVGGRAPEVGDAWDYVRHNNILKAGVDLAVYQVLSRHVHALDGATRGLSHEVEELNRVLLARPHKNLAPDILRVRKRAMAMKQVLEPEGEVFDLLETSDFPFVGQHNRPYFQDIAAEMKEVRADVEVDREGLSGMVESFTSMQSNQMNKIMRLLTFISILALPATTVASIYGMNFAIPEIHWKYGYWYSLVLMAVITVMLLIYVKRHGDWN